MAQSGPGKVRTGSHRLQGDSIVFSPSSASAYIVGLLKSDHLWRPSGDTLRLSMERLIDHFVEPFDSVASRLKTFNYDSLGLEQADVIRHDTLPLRWLDRRNFIIDTVPLEKAPFIIQKTIITRVADTMPRISEDNIILMPEVPDTLKKSKHAYTEVSRDTISERFIDLDYLDSKNIRMHQLVNGEIMPPVIPAGKAERGCRVAGFIKTGHCRYNPRMGCPERLTVLYCAGQTDARFIEVGGQNPAELCQ